MKALRLLVSVVMVLGVMGMAFAAPATVSSASTPTIERPISGLIPVIPPKLPEPYGPPPPPPPTGK
ncbi:hypothetical protein EHM69_11440 [candidate division KSB1 bacterium]|nr:MAG: hypothetical protein EHM69_11440 [candidate division KSB1 bacterium]